MIRKTLSFVVLLVFVVISCSAFVFADEKQKFESYDVTDSESTLIQGYTDDDAEILNEDYPEEYQNEDSADKLPIESFEEEYYVTFEDNEGENAGKTISASSSKGLINQGRLVLNCYGKNSIAYGNVQVIRVKGNLSGKINVRLYSKKTGGSWVKKDEKTNISANSEKTITVKENISKTRYWRVKVTGTFMGNPISRSAYSGLLNKKGVKYPVAYEVYTKRLVAKPSTELKVDRTPRDPKFRKNYITWFEKKYPKANVDWSKYEIHHIRPLKYGGSNKISNGIAITIAQHKKLNTWWKNY